MKDTDLDEPTTIRSDAKDALIDDIIDLKRQRDKMMAVIVELLASAEYWSDYDVPLGIVERMREAVK